MVYYGDRQSPPNKIQEGNDAFSFYPTENLDNKKKDSPKRMEKVYSHWTT
jgi:hypothetical protein